MKCAGTCAIEGTREPGGYLSFDWEKYRLVLGLCVFETESGPGGFSRCGHCLCFSWLGTGLYLFPWSMWGYVRSLHGAGLATLLCFCHKS